MYDYSDDIISDLHKDARGFRPREYFWEEWTQSPANTKQRIWDMLCDELERNNIAEKAAEEQAIVSFRKSVAGVMKVANCNWKSALRHLAVAEDCNIEEHSQGFDYFLWLQGIGASDRKNIAKLYFKG
jgi:hypothetical protein